MKKYIRKLALVSSLLVLLLVMLGVVRMKIIQSHSWKLSKDVHVLFMGASHVNRAVNDSLFNTAINWASPSERYLFTYVKLQHLLPANPQVDTVFLELAPTDLWECADYKYHDNIEQSKFVKLYWPFLSWSNFLVYKSEPIQVLNLIVESLFDIGDISQYNWWKHMGGYMALNEVMDVNNVEPCLEEEREWGNSLNYENLHKIIDICKENGVKLFFIETPTYHPEYFYNQQYFYKAYNEEFSDVEFLDYSKWPIENRYMYDPHHLNNEGAKIFTDEIKRRFNIK